MAKDNPGAITPAAAVARHLEWLAFALEAAKDEEQRRRGRLDRATDKNRGKRTVRLGEVAAEIRELSALVDGLRDLQVRAGTAVVSVRRRPGPKPNASAGRVTPTARRTTPKSTALNGTEPKAVAAPKAAAAPKAPSTPKAAPSKPTPRPRRRATKRTSTPSA